MAYFEQVKLADTNGDPINAATEVTLEEVRDAVTTGELVEAIQVLRMLVDTLTRTVGMAMPDTSGRLRVNAEAAVISSGTVTTVSTVTTVTTVTGQTNIGGLPANQQIPSLMMISANQLRANINVS